MMNVLGFMLLRPVSVNRKIVLVSPSLLWSSNISSSRQSMSKLLKLELCDMFRARAKFLLCTPEIIVSTGIKLVDNFMLSYSVDDCSKTVYSAFVFVNSRRQL
jgi:hypothetical protein